MQQCTLIHFICITFIAAKFVIPAESLVVYYSCRLSIHFIKLCVSHGHLNCSTVLPDSAGSYMSGQCLSCWKAWQRPAASSDGFKVPLFIPECSGGSSRNPKLLLQQLPYCLWWLPWICRWCNVLLLQLLCGIVLDFQKQWNIIKVHSYTCYSKWAYSVRHYVSS